MSWYQKVHSTLCRILFTQSTIFKRLSVYSWHKYLPTPTSSLGEEVCPSPRNHEGSRAFFACTGKMLISLVLFALLWKSGDVGCSLYIWRQYRGHMTFPYQLRRQILKIIFISFTISGSSYFSPLSYAAVERGKSLVSFCVQYYLLRSFVRRNHVPDFLESWHSKIPRF